MSFRATVPCALRLAVALVLLQTSAIVNAGQNSQATFLVHLTTPTSKNACLASSPPSCNEIRARGVLDTDYFAYVILGNLDTGVSATRFGVTYDGVAGSGVDVSSWTSCTSGLQFPVSGWPAPGGGNTLTWLGCQAPTNQMAVVGYFSLSAYGPDDIWVRPHPLFGASVADCAGMSDVITLVDAPNPFGWASFSANGLSGGSSPCGLDAGSCHISGPTGVDMGTTGIVYTMHPEEITVNGSWRVGGNGQIVTSDNSSATVNATTPGSFTIAYQRNPECWLLDGCGCAITVHVFGPTEVRPTTWGAIKARLSKE